MNRQRDEGKPWCDVGDRYRVGTGKKQTFFCCCCSRGTSSSVWATLSLYIEKCIRKISLVVELYSGIGHHKKNIKTLQPVRNHP